MITETLISNANEKIKSLCSENKKLWYWIYILICVSIVFVIILIYFIYRKSKNNLEHRKDNNLMFNCFLSNFQVIYSFSVYFFLLVENTIKTKMR